MIEPVTIGRARLYLGLGLPLHFHVAGLTETDEVLSLIGLGGSRKLPKRDNVVNGKRLSDVLVAMRAYPILLANYLLSNSKPALAPVGSDAAHITGRFIGVENAGGLEAFPPAKSRKPVLASKPPFLVKGFSALLAGALNTLFPVMASRPRQPFGKCVCGPFTGPEFIPHQVRLGADIESFSRPQASAAFKRTEARPFCAVGPNRIGRSTFFTSQFNWHLSKITEICFGSMGGGSSGVAVHRKPKPTQTGFDMGDAA